MEKVELISFSDDIGLARAAAGAWLDSIAEQRGSGNPHCVALSGGRIAKTFFSAVAVVENAGAGLWSSVQFFWSDERCVPPDDPDSNYRIARELLVTPLKISEGQTHRIRGEEPPEIAAAKATSEICRVVPLNPDGQPVLDLIFLGMGEDGHVASLFPGEAGSLVADRTVYRAIKNSPKPPPNRVTLDYAAIAAARQVWVLVSGAGKSAALRESLGSSGKTPLARVIQSRPHTRIFSDAY